MKRLLLPILVVLCSATVQSQPAIGSTSPEIALKDVNGNEVRLSSLKGHVVLIDFWASWCGPCRKTNKFLVNVYPKLKARGFEIYGISIDDDKSSWKSAIAADRINWLQVNEGGGWEAPVASEWKIDQIPTSYLLDKNGKIIARDLDGHQLERAVNKLLKE